MLEARAKHLPQQEAQRHLAEAEARQTARQAGRMAGEAGHARAGHGETAKLHPDGLKHKPEGVRELEARAQEQKRILSNFENDRKAKKTTKRLNNSEVRKYIDDKLQNIDAINDMRRNNNQELIPKPEFKIADHEYISQGGIDHFANTREHPHLKTSSPAQMVGETVYINPKADFWENPAEFLKEQFAAGYWSSKSPDSLIFHEVGHYAHEMFLRKQLGFDGSLDTMTTVQRMKEFRDTLVDPLYNTSKIFSFR
jgi:hypothetical protein